MGRALERNGWVVKGKAVAEIYQNETVPISLIALYRSDMSLAQVS